ncbi:type VI secretion system baseplate subunit TssF [Burkholderia cepacia]|uniref:type VI secretion system baseplate subunit TssF n=1 Tax=Burkholderia cepacia TaxID=292 RepID=UPI00075E9216|nr:type VI secretion system baseplate subunit TssF [Burkholderia cepacia]OUE40287.1 type VI secretion protein [Burkholderia territorii]KVU59062.1 type VI secretion protein [Burkholderia cepacia]KVX57536.1 type VI secretion protein [Burkholderia cepacia]KWD59459.1 type VI secretion protein [Burkholderia cepacia]KWD71864.1 type VI secretion protein [Burkholderia cepacia]
MEDLLPHYEYEVGLLRRSLTEFAARHPKIGARLGVSDQGDFHAERLIQAFALLAARVDANLEDEYSELTESLLETLYPLYLRTVPACAIAQFDPTALFGQLTEPIAVPRGTQLDANAKPCRFRTVFDVTLCPLRVRSARVGSATSAPASVQLPAETTDIVSITFGSDTISGTFDEAIPSGPLRIYLSGDRSVVAALTDALLLHACAAYVEVDDIGRWTTLSRIPIEIAGFDGKDALLPETPTAKPTTFQSLIEYFAFPEKFQFVDIDLGRIQRAARAADAHLLTLHIAIRGGRNRTATIQALSGLDATTFRLFCTPVVNLFRRAAIPIQTTGNESGYPVIPQPLATGYSLDVYSIDAVYLGERMLPEQEVTTSMTGRISDFAAKPYSDFSHGSPSAPPTIYWRVSRTQYAENHETRRQLLLSLVDIHGEGVCPDRPQIDVDVSATNGDLPSRLPIGAPDSDLLHEGSALSCPITLLTRPTLPNSLPRGQNNLWRVLAAMTVQPFNLTQSGLHALKEFLGLHLPSTTSIARRNIDAISRLEHKPAVRWMAIDGHFPSFVRGIEIFLFLDEDTLRDVPLSVFAPVLDRLFAPYAPANGFIQLIVRSTQTGEDLFRLPPRPGTRALI